MKHCLLCGVPLPQEYIDNSIRVCDCCSDECDSDAESVLDSMFFARGQRYNKFEEED